MHRFAFYGRVSTEDQQDPEASRNWQLTRARALIETHGAIVVEFFDVGQSRSLPWKRRPEADRLLDAVKRPDRGFDAVVIGEPQRAFYGSQYGLTFPVLAHYGVQLWVPEVGGAINPESEAHDLVMSVFGGMSKGERNRIKIRVRTAMAAQAQVEGRYLGGRPPYGYRLADAGPHPNPAKAAEGKRMHRLELDAVAAPVVAQIFTEFLDGRGMYAIAERLTTDGLACPSAHDPGRNRHRRVRAWSKGAVRAILTNPRYTGFQVWNRQHKKESLIDVDDVGLGHESRLVWNEQAEWVWSDKPAHPGIITRDIFEQAAAVRATRSPRSNGLRSRKALPYALRGLLFCGLCGRRIQAATIADRPRYRCRFPAEYALANTIDHPKAVYVREDHVLPVLDRWLAEAFAPDQLQRSLDALADAERAGTAAAGAVAEQVRRRVAECDRKLAQYRSALDAGADPDLVASWIRDTQTDRAAAMAQMSRPPKEAPKRLGADEIRELVTGLSSMVSILEQAHPDDKAEVYRQLGLTLTYHPNERTVVAEAAPRPCA